MFHTAPRNSFSCGEFLIVFVHPKVFFGMFFSRSYLAAAGKVLIAMKGRSKGCPLGISAGMTGINIMDSEWI